MYALELVMYTFRINNARLKLVIRTLELVIYTLQLAVQLISI